MSLKSKLYITGRDVADTEIRLEFYKVNCLWKLIEVAELECEIQIKQKIAEQNQAGLDNLKDKFNTEKNFIYVSSKKERLKNIDEISIKPTLLNTSKLIVIKDEFKDVKTLAKNKL